MKNRFTTVVVATTIAISGCLLAFTSKSSSVEKKTTAVTTVCPLEGKADCSESTCPLKGTPDCPYDKTVPDCCKDKK